MSVFGRNMMGGLDCFCLAYDKSEWMVLLYIAICNRVYRKICCFIRSVNIAFTFLTCSILITVIPLNFPKRQGISGVAKIA